ncbi:MAG: rod shape-determining protein MreD [Thermodesulfovibrionales bacterium]|jgi:rod shape-determining protein MreD
MRNICIVLGIVLSLILQTKVSIFGIAPEPMVIAAYYVGINATARKGMLVGSLMGVIEDSAVGGMIGPNLLGKGLVGFFSSSLFGGVFRWTPLLGMLVVFSLTIMDGFIVFLSQTFYETPPAPWSKVILTIIIQGLVNAAIGGFIKPKNAE